MYNVVALGVTDIFANVSSPALIPEPAPFGDHIKPNAWIGLKRYASFVAVHPVALRPGTAVAATPLGPSIPCVIVPCELIDVL